MDAICFKLGMVIIFKYIQHLRWPEVGRMSDPPRVDPTKLTIDGQLASPPEDDLPPLVHSERHQQVKTTTSPLRMIAGLSLDNLNSWLCDSS